MIWAVIIAIAVCIIIALGFYAGRLLFLLKQQNQRQQQVREQRIATISESIFTIAKAMAFDIFICPFRLLYMGGGKKRKGRCFLGFEN